MNIAQAILEIYPTLDSSRDFEVHVDETGKQYIHAWNNPNPRPTDAELAKAWFRVAVKKKAAEWDARQVKEGGKPYEDKLRAATGQDVPPHAIVWNLIMDIAETLRTTEQTVNLKNAVDMRKKRDRGLDVLKTKTPGTDPIADANAILALRWEDIV
jgi:hypothetical protein